MKFTFFASWRYLMVGLHYHQGERMIAVHPIPFFGFAIYW